MLLPEMQITVQCGQQRDNDDVDDAPMHNHNADAPQSIKDAAKGAIDAVVRRAIVDNILPNIISLKIFLQTKRSPLLRETMVLIREMSRLHRKHLDEFLANDRVLKAEIEFDIKRLDVCTINMKHFKLIYFDKKNSVNNCSKKRHEKLNAKKLQNSIQKNAISRQISRKSNERYPKIMSIDHHRSSKQIRHHHHHHHQLLLLYRRSMPINIGSILMLVYRRKLISMIRWIRQQTINRWL